MQTYQPIEKTHITNEQAIDDVFEIMDMVELGRLKFQYEEEIQVLWDLCQYVMSKVDEETGQPNTVNV
ncbi:hypothetical protein [Thiomicrospira cyclica]|uniref:Uncharacterized protein n=1 Tax=Thiomicrospira cyclica (strain DSM 14477 / JCM 11371 / ALM1) TaxID=717773 RepID=F6DCF7_THICA|nr:hypothetical protein [Thiomicrospira cyclica]AEG31543.1 hypothetical protein Thicy_0771 [Thiomicrospira cyclica ALM1]